MPRFTALVYEADDATALDRTLNCLSVASDILVLLNGNHETEKVAHKHSARVREHIPGVTVGAYTMDGFYPWTLVIRAGDELGPESLLALQEWRQLKEDSSALYRLQGDSPYLPVLVNRDRVNWIGDSPSVPNDAPLLLPLHRQRAA